MFSSVRGKMFALGGLFAGVYFGLSWRENNEAWEREQQRLDRLVRERMEELKREQEHDPK